MINPAPPRESNWPQGAIFTIGHSTLPIDAFVALLQAYRIEQVADVRAVPRSRHDLAPVLTGQPQA